MAVRGARASQVRLALAGAMALAVHGGALLAAYLWTPRAEAPGLTDPPAMDLSPLDEAEVRELISALGPLPGAEPEMAPPVTAPAPRPRAAENEARLPTRAAPAVPALAQPLDSPFDERVRMPAPRGPVEPSAEGETHAPRTNKRATALARRADAPDAAVPEPRGDAGRLVDAGRVAPMVPVVVVSEMSEHGQLAGGHNQADAPVDPALALFIARMNERVRAEWHPTQVYKQINPKFEGELSNLATTVEVRLRADGVLERAKITGRSGTTALDEEALAALKRAQPFSPPPAELIDAAGGLTFPFRFDFDLTVAAFLKQVTRRIREEWRPSPAFRRFGGWGEDRSTAIRILLKDDGTLIHASVIGSSGVDLLDNSALSALKLGTRLAPPASALRRPGSLVPVRVVFVHALRGPDLVYAERERAKGTGTGN
jgi:TonB family protein